MKDAAWATLYEGPNLGTPDPESGWYYYIVEARLAASGNCNVEGGEFAGPFINSFKVRATGILFSYAADLAFIGHDVFGPWATPESPSFPIRDTTYDGEFVFYSVVTSASSQIIYKDADADARPDDDPGASLRGPLDVKADGVAVGASATVRYDIYDPDLSLVFSNLNPSGSNDGVNDLDVEEIPISTNGHTGYWTWAWSGVYTHNDVRIWIPTGSIAYPMLSQRSTLPKVSAAQSISSWAAAAISPTLLPIMLGSGTKGSAVSTPAEASAVLSQVSLAFGGAPPGKTTVCHRTRGRIESTPLRVSSSALSAHLAHGDDSDRPKLMSLLAAELLAVKLNAVVAGQVAKPLAAAHIYGTTMTVGSAIEEAEAILTTDGPCQWTSDGSAKVGRLIQVLHAVNAGEVTFNVASPRSAGIQALATPEQAASPPNGSAPPGAL